MRNIEIQPEEFIPIQSNGIHYDKLSTLNEKRTSPIPPVIALEYLKKYLLLDGNHRAYFMNLKGRTVLTQILETNQDVKNSNAISLIGCETIEDIISKYNE